MAGLRFFKKLHNQLTAVRRIVNLILGQGDIATEDDEDHAHFFVCQILGALNKARKMLHFSETIMHGHLIMVAIRPGSMFFIDTGGPEW